MGRHQIKNSRDWLNIRYDGEDADDGCANEMSLYRQEGADRLQVLLSNIDFAGQNHDNTFSLTRSDARKLADFLEAWLADKE